MIVLIGIIIICRISYALKLSVTWYMLGYSCQPKNVLNFNSRKFRKMLISHVDANRFYDIMAPTLKKKLVCYLGFIAILLVTYFIVNIYRCRYHTDRGVNITLTKLFM